MSLARRLLLLVPSALLVAACHATPVGDGQGLDGGDTSVGDSGLDATDETRGDTGRDTHADDDADVGETSSSETSVDADASTDADATETAPTGCDKHYGSPMVRIDSSWGSYCIDKREATISEFNEYLVAPGAPFDAPAVYCAGQKATRPTKNIDPLAGDFPANAMTWCYAHAFCKWAGKRLCGAIGGGSAPVDSADLHGEWTYACANGTMNLAYAYGATYDPTVCNSDDHPASGGSGYVMKPLTKPGCHGTVAPFSSIYDMTGNIGEYDNTVSDFGDAGGFVIRGRGGYPAAGVDTRCDSASGFGIEGYGSGAGIRCCADP